MDPIVIPISLWASAQYKLQQEQDKKKKKKNAAKNNNDNLLCTFAYNLQTSSFLECNVQRVSNLFFEFASAIGEDVSKEYIVVQMKDDDSDYYHDAENEEQQRKKGGGYYQYQNDPKREYILRIGICVTSSEDDAAENADVGYTSTTLFHFIGCSNSQVQQHSYVFRRSQSFHENVKRVLRMLPTLENLQKKKGIPKRVKYAGLTFSGVTMTSLPKSTIVEQIYTEKRNNFDFCDGPGLISRKLAKEIQIQLGLKGQQCPSIFQIRFCGKIGEPNLDGAASAADTDITGYICKGVLVVDPTNDETYKIQLRKSMLKVPSSHEACQALQYKLGICDHSGKSIPGRLGQQLICLLSGTVDDNVFLDLQQEHFDHLHDAWTDPFSLAWVLALDRNPHPWKCFHSLLLQHGSESSTSMYKKCMAAVLNDRQCPKSTKVQIPLASSRTLFGAVLPELLHNELEEGECIVLLEDGPLQPPEEPSSDDDAFVIVSRSPSYFPGDVRVLRNKRLDPDHPVAQLRNCILFATKGERPEPDKMGGGDLDGDKYLVIWHPKLLRYASKLRAIEPTSYDPPSPSEVGPHCKLNTQSNDWVHYAALTDNAMLGEVESTFYKIASRYGVKSTQVKQLNDLFANLVDRNPASLDDFKKLKGLVSGGPCSSSSCFWQEMAMKQMTFAAERSQVTESDTWKSFQDSIHQYVSQPAVFRELILETHKHHFQSSPRAADVRRIMIAWDKSNTQSTAANHRSVHESIPSRSDCKEVTNEERNFFDAMENQAHKVFGAQLAPILKAKKQAEVIYRLHESRKKTLLAKQDLNKNLFENLDKSLANLEEYYERERILLRQHESNGWETLWMEHKTDDIAELLKERARQQVAMQTLMTKLRAAEEELSSQWWTLAFFSEKKRACALQKERILASIRDLQAEAAETKRRLDLLCGKRLHEVQEHIENLDSQRKSLKQHFEQCNEKIEDFIEGKEAKRLADQTSELRGYLKKLREEASALKQKADQCRRSLLEHKEMMNSEENIYCPATLEWQAFHVEQRLAFKLREVDNCSANLTSTELASEGIYCPKIHSEQEEKYEKLSCEEASLEIGRQQILYKIEEARRHWENFVRSGSNSCEGKRKEEWKSKVHDLQRWYDIEENRLLGLALNGKRNGPMPVYHKRGELHRLMAKSQVVIVTAGTGCGKSTQVPQYVADDVRLLRSKEFSATNNKPARVCCTQPRRVAARRIAERVAGEYKTKLGDLVGFRVGSRGRSRSESVQVSENTVIEFVTEGLLLANLSRSKDFVSRYDVIIIDEAHERNFEQDMLLALLREKLRESSLHRPQFKLIVMSASIDPTKFSKYFFDCPTMDCPGKIFPVTELYRPIPDSCEKLVACKDVISHAVKVLYDDIVDNPESEEGDVLIFLTGAREIDECVAAIQKKAAKTESMVVAYPLYSKLEEEKIKAATTPTHRTAGLENRVVKDKKKQPLPVRKVICCTTIAETSLTIDRVRYVIDSGLAKKSCYDHQLRCSVLKEELISQASTKQRRGRAGRTNTGWCYYLYSQECHENEMNEYDRPKILDEPVDELLLFSLRQEVFGTSIEHVALLDMPEQENIDDAKERLTELSFIQKIEGDKYELTKDGKVAVALFSVKPEAVRMMLNSCTKPQCLASAIRLGVIMSQDEILTSNNKQDSDFTASTHIYGDHLEALKHFEWFEREVKGGRGSKNALKKRCLARGLDFKVLEGIQDDVDNCHRELKQRGLLPSQFSKRVVMEKGDSELLLRLLISGFFHRISEFHCIDYLDRLGCSALLGTTQNLFLDKDSCLQNAIRNAKHLRSLEGYKLKDNDYSCQANDDELIADDLGDIPMCRYAVQEELQPSFLLYGRLFRPGSSTAKVFMLDVSAVEGNWIEEEVPKVWLDRVKFDLSKRSKCRVVLRNISHHVLLACDKSTNGGFFRQVKEDTGADVVTSLQNCLVSIIGEQTNVDRAKTAVQRKIADVLKDKFKKEDIAYNQFLRFSSGMRVLGPNDNNFSGESQHFKHFHSAPTNDRKFYLSSESVSISMKGDKKRIEVAIKRSWRRAVIEKILNGVQKSSPVPFKIKKDGHVFVLEADEQPAIGDFDFQSNINKRNENYARNDDRRNNPGRRRNKNGNKIINDVFNQLKGASEFEAKIVPWDFFFTKNKSSKALCKAICNEAFQGSFFWSKFHEHVSSRQQSLIADFCYTESQESYKVIGPDREKLIMVLEHSISLLRSSSDTFAVNGSDFERYEVRRFLAMLNEIKKKCPGVLFIVEVKAKANDGESETPQFMCLDDYEHSTLMRILQNQSNLHAIRLQYSALKAHDRSAARKLLDQNFGEDWLQRQEIVTVAPDSKQNGFLTKSCVMCRRKLSIATGKKSDKNGSKEKTDKPCGWTLTICGCAYCRECFKVSVKESLLNCDEARCFCCESIVTAKDCYRILSAATSHRKPSKTDTNDWSDWNDLCRVAEGSHCARNSHMLSSGMQDYGYRNYPHRNGGWFSCLDCGVSMVYPRGYLFFYCRNSKCRNKVCTRCRCVVTSEQDIKRCIAEECEEDREMFE